MTTVWGAARVAVALVALRFFSDRSIINEVLGVAGFTTGMVLGLFLLGRMRRPVSSQAALTGLVIGFLVVFFFWAPSLWNMKLLAWPWYAPIGTTTTVMVALLINALGSRNGSSADRGAQPGLDQPG
jgi:Na+/proline symporter